eukprot:Pgem_evm1s12800
MVGEIDVDLAIDLPAPDGCLLIDLTVKEGQNMDLGNLTQHFGSSIVLSPSIHNDAMNSPLNEVRMTVEPFCEKFSISAEYKNAPLFNDAKFIGTVNHSENDITGLLQTYKEFVDEKLVESAYDVGLKLKVEGENFMVGFQESFDALVDVLCLDSSMLVGEMDVSLI